MLCPHRQRRCKHALSALSAAMYMYSAVQRSVANGEDAEWDDEEVEGGDPDAPVESMETDEEELDALDAISQLTSSEGGAE